ncbi:MAG TPA: endonuclease/exonuclease/phosphatase family protein [Devosiaceae bacterium]|jgi:endonuclease/exonuclease/phosphatase family metal-dependent hydrolase|nr:endonuclease/exonuclease/phosphatase family protein [Devosiaceae bacterium]
MITVASYNIRKSVGTDWRRQPDRILQILNEIDADVVALQEVDRRFGQRTSSLSIENVASVSPYAAVRFGRRPDSLGWHGNAILVRKGSEVLRQRRIVLPALEPRGAVLVDVAVAGVAIRVIGLHLGLVGLWRTRQAARVLNYLKRLESVLPTVIMGDLNQWTTEGGSLAHFAADHNVIAPGPSFHSSRPLLALDRIITSHDFRVQEAGVHLSPLSRRGSDHLPVWARLDLEPAAAATDASP